MERADHGKDRKKMSRAEQTGIVLLPIALALFFISPLSTVILLLLFLLLCLGAPFFPELSFFLPIFNRGRCGTKGVALTFDDGPCPESTPILLELLERYNLTATFFVVGKNAEKHPELLRKILDCGHSIGNHSLRHDNLLMLRGPQALRQDIHATQRIIEKSGVRSLVFRPPIGITNPYLGKILDTEGLVTIGYSCRALDRGNKNINNLADKIFRKLAPGDIILLHDLPPYQKEMTTRWQQEIEKLFTALHNTYTVVPLAQLIEQPVMIRQEH